MGDDDKLSLIRQRPHIAGGTHHVGLVQRCLDLVHDAERGGMHFQDGKVQSNGHKGLLAAGKQRNGFQRLARRLGLDLDAAVQNVLRVLQLQLGLTAAEQLHKGLLEALAEKLELLGKNFGHLLRDLPDDAGQLALGFLHVVPLIRQICIPSVDPLELVDGPHIDGAETVDLPFQLRHPAGRLRDAFQLDPLGLSVGMAQLIGFPQLIQNLLFLHGGGGQLRFQPAGCPLQIQEGFVHLLPGAALGGTLRFQRDLLLADDRQPLRNGGALRFQFRLRGLPLPDLLLRGSDLLPVLGKGRLLLASVAGQLRRQLPQVGSPAQCALPVGGH